MAGLRRRAETPILVGKTLSAARSEADRVRARLALAWDSALSCANAPVVVWLTTHRRWICEDAGLHPDRVGWRMGGAPVRRGILALDIEGFGHHGRTDPHRARLRTRLHALLDHALRAAEIPPEQVAARSDLGDGILVLFDPAVPAATLLHPLLSTLTTKLTTDNQQATGPGRLRLRVAVHEGHVLADPHGHTGEDLNHAFRLLDAQATRTVLAGSPSADVVLAVSDAVYQGVVRHAYQGLDPVVWQPVRVHAKETCTRAWVHLPGLASQPELSSVLAAPPLGPTTLPIPHELPSLPEAFTGRTRELEQLARLLQVAAGAGGGPVVISAIDGMGGIGKSALAIQAWGQAASLNNLGIVYTWLRRYPEAVDHHQQALTLFRELGDRVGQAEVLRDLGDALRGLGRQQQAREAWQEALELCEALEIPEADEVRDRLARLPAGSDEPDEPAAAGESTATGPGLPQPR